MYIPGEKYNPWRMFVGCFIPGAVLRCRLLSARAKLVFGRLCQYDIRDAKQQMVDQKKADELALRKRFAEQEKRKLELQDEYWASLAETIRSKFVEDARTENVHISLPKEAIVALAKQRH